MTNDLEKLISRSVAGLPWNPTPPLGTLSWSELPDGRNMDELPDGLCPDRGCPTCGSVWVDYVAVGFSVRHYEGMCTGEFLIDRGLFMVRPIHPGLPVSVHAVRTRCADGHEYEFFRGDAGFRSFSSSLWWQNAALMAVGSMYWRSLRT